GAPGQGTAAAAVAVIVDDGLVPKRLGAHDETRGAKGAQPRDLARDAILGNVDPAQRLDPFRRGSGRLPSAACERERGGAKLENGSAVHTIHPILRRAMVLGSEG